MSGELETPSGEVIAEEPESEVIRTLRAQLTEEKAAKKAAVASAEKALVDARAQLERESTAQRFMDAAGYPGMTETVLSLVEGEVTVEKAVSTLEGLKLPVDAQAFADALAGQPAPTSTGSQSGSSTAEEIASIASLGGQISAAAENTPNDNFETDLEATKTLEDIVAVAEKHKFNDPS